ncbi:MAG TPA: amino acid adenylation domain-containing protein [Longimicrobium sp.]
MTLLAGWAILLGRLSGQDDVVIGAPELLELPADRPRPARQDFAGATVEVALDPELTAALKALSRRHGTTLYMTLLAGWATVLARLSGQGDVVVGTPSANRGRAEVEELIGFFVNLLPVRVDLSGRPTVAQLLGRVKTRALEAQRNQDIPFEQVVERLRPARSLAYSPLFQALFAWQDETGAAPALPGLEVAQVPGAELATAKFDLALVLEEDEGRIRGALNYATALFDRATVERWAGYLRHALREMAADDGQAAGELRILPAAERRVVVEAWNETDAAYPRNACVHALFEAQAARTPDALAVVAEDAALTYAELNARANRLARRLRGRGVRPGARVALLVPRSVQLVVAELAVLKAGAAYVPIDPAFPAERIAYMVADSGSALVLHPHEVTVDDGAAENPGITVPGDALAYVMYTSGSTGAPKGVMVPHRGIARLVLNNGYAAFGPDDRVAFAANPAFDATTMEVWAPLLNGGRIVVIEPRVFLEPAAMARRLREQGVTALFLTTAVFNQFAASIPGALAGVRSLMTGGERADAASFARVLNAGGTGTLINGYGPTETTTFAVTHAVRHVGEGASSIPLGRPIANTRVYVLDGRGEPVPVGVAGELYIGGDGVAHGYLNRPALTAERFVPDAFGGEPGARLYRTGDLCRWLADGTLEFLGRNDFQVKVRGFRIELGEIEARLAEHEALREAVVLAREDAPGDKRLVAYYVAAEPVEAEALRRHVGERLPEHMVPAAFVRLEQFPLTPNGKLDRRALPAPDGDAFATRGYEAPAGEMEQALAAAWSEVLGVERVGRRDHFFELGGHSLLAVRMVSRVRRALGLDAALGTVFQRPVLADFAQALAAAGRAELPAIGPVDRGAPLPLSYAQQRLWFLEQSGDLGSTYHVPLGLRLRGALDRGALLRALDRIVARHEVLRTTFGIRHGEPEQRIAPETAGFALVEQDLAGQGSDALRRVVADEAAAPFDLERGPLVRGRLLRLADDDHALLLTLHHVVVDEWSIGILMDELGTLYAAFRAGAADPLPALPVQYADYAAWQRRWVESEVLEAQAGYWMDALAGAPALLELPTDRPRPRRQDFAGASIRLELDAALTAGLKALGRRHGTTLFMTLLAGWATVLARLSGQREVVVGTPSANRGRGEIEGLVGFFVNTLALRVDLSARPTVAQLLEQVKRRALEAQQNQDIPFEQVVERVQPPRSLAHSPLFQVLFAWHGAEKGMPALPGLALSALDGAADDAAKFDLSLGLSERDGTIAGEVTYATSLYDRATVERHLACLRRVLEEMVAGDARAVDRLPMLPDAERRRVLRAWNGTEAEYPREACIHELFQAQVERTPDAPALVCGGEALTYAALNRRANRLAHHLRGLGVGPDARVGICVARGVEMVVAQLATLKAGGAYVPLDPNYPAERLACMLEDSAPQVLLTQAPLAERFRPLDVPVLDLAGESAWRHQPDGNPARDGLRPGHLAYVIFTSGSTGRPKGVMLSHGNAVNFIAWGAAAFRGKGLDRTLFSTSLNFDLAVFELFVPLHVGATVCLVDDALALHRGPADVTLVNTVPSALRALLDGEGLPAGVRTVNLAGEPLKRGLAERIFAETGVDRLCNLYGPSETTTYSTWVEMRRGDGFAPHVGGPVANTQVYLLDPWGEPVPAGVVGELYIGGDGVARGYQGRPALTAERFVPDPFGKEPGARMYRTGDLGRWLPQGAIEFLGRNDHQVKIRGFRIELGEIEARLAEHPGVREAVVMAREDAAGDRRLVAWWVGGDEVGVEALRAHLRARLAEYMVPAAYVRLERLPLTPNGKLDRAALPAPPDDAYARRAYQAPVGETEQGLAEIWSELLGVERVGRGDHFFELGGHSLLATRAASRISERFGTRLPATTLFAHTHLGELARAVDEARAAQPAGGAADAGMDARISPFSVDLMSDDDVDTMLADLLSNGNDA